MFRYVEDLKVAKYLISAVAVLAMGFVLASVQMAQAQGFHFGGGGVHVDAASSYGSYGSGYGCYPQTTYYGGGWGGWGGHSDWHNTTHVDYHRGGYVPHYGHLDYSPGHFDSHSSGHWDRHY